MSTVIDKIQALLAKARDEACSESEAEACLLRARKLMDQHGIEEGELPEEGREGVDGEMVTPKYLEPWRKILFNEVARYYGCSALFFGGDKRYMLAGRRSSRAVAISMSTWLDTLVVKLAREWRKSVNGTRGEQLNFERACGGRIASRLREMTAMATRGDGGEGGTALALVNEVQAAQQWIDVRYNPKATTAKSRVGGAGAVAGKEAGGRVGLGAQVGGKSSGGVRLLG